MTVQPSAPDESSLPEGLVWHYTDGAGLASIVTNQVLWSTASAFLNDAHEVALGYRRIRAELEARADAGDVFARTIRAKVAETEHLSSGPSPGVFFILSAAQHWDLLAMWRCYGGAGESYAIGLDPLAPLGILCDPTSPLIGQPDDPALGRLVRQRPWSPVRYALADQQALVAAVFDGLPEELAAAREIAAAAGEIDARQGMLDVLSETLDDMEQALVLIKHEGFHDERELRHSTTLIHPAGASGFPGVVRYRPTAYGMAPYLWLTGASPGGGLLTTARMPLPIRAVAISPSPNGPAAEASLRAMLADRGYDVPVLRSGIPFRG